MPSVAAIVVPEGKAEIIRIRRCDPGLWRLRVPAGRKQKVRLPIQTERHQSARHLQGNERQSEPGRQLRYWRPRSRWEPDPALEKEAAHNAAADTFGRCLERYLARPKGRRRDSTLKEIRRHLERNLAPLHRLHIKKIDRRRIADELSRLTIERAARTQSNRTRASLSKFLNWCIGEGYADVNVVLATNKNEKLPATACSTTVN